MQASLHQEALRDLADDFNRDAGHGLRGAEGRRGPAADLIDFSQNTRGKTKYGLVVMDVFTQKAAVEPLQNKNAETVGRATKRAGSSGSCKTTPTSSSTTRTSPTGA